MLTPYGKRECLGILAGSLALMLVALLLRWWVPAALVFPIALALLAFFRDPKRRIPSQRGIMVAPADGRVSSIHRIDHFEPLGQPALCVRIFLSVLDVHVNRSPCHGRVVSITHAPGRYMNALNPESAGVNESNLVVLEHPTRREPLAAVKQIAGAIARRIVCDLRPSQIVQRGERFGMIKFGSTTELYVPLSLLPEPQVQQGQRVRGGATVLLKVRIMDQPSDPGTAASPTVHAAG